MLPAPTVTARRTRPGGEPRHPPEGQAGSAAHQGHNGEKQGACENQLLHNSIAFCSMVSAPLTSSIFMARATSAVRFLSTSANLSSVMPSAASLSVLPGNNRVLKRKAATVDRPPINTVSSKVTGTNASVELSGLPPTFKDQSQMLV